MNWKIILYLSLFGFVMAFATIFLLSGKIEPLFWLVIMLISAYLVAKNAPGKYFLHGFLVAVANCVWITIIHFLLYRVYASHHPHMMSSMRNMPLTNHPRLMMLVYAPFNAALTGCFLGLLAFIASKIFRKSTGTDIPQQASL